MITIYIIAKITKEGKPMLKIKRIFTIFLAVCILVNVTAPFSVFGDDNSELQPLTNLGLNSPLGIVVCVSTGKVLYEHGNIHERAYPASMTKVMTALLLLESGASMDDRIFHSREAIFGFNRNSSHIYMSPTETLTVSQALYAIMLPSANDVSNAIAEFVAGDMDSFAALMTQRARELGAVNTNFTNAHGLHHAEHYTTLYDMHLIMREAIRHEKFLEVINTSRFIINPTELQPEPRIIDNTNLLVRPTMPQFSSNIVGGKTGWTTPAGHNLVSYGHQDGVRLISVVMSAERRDFIFNDTQTLMNHSFAQFSTYEMFTSQDFSFFVDLTQRTSQGTFVIGHLPIFAESDVILRLPNGINPDDISISYTLPDRLIAPISQGFAVGYISLYYGERLLQTTALRTAHEGTPLAVSDLVSISSAPIPSRNIANIIYGTEEYFPLPDWLTTPRAFLYAAVAAISLLLTAAIIKFLRFTKRKKARRNIYRKGHVSKTYKYR